MQALMDFQLDSVCNFLGATGSDMVATVDYHSSGGYENLRGANPVGEIETMAMPQRDDTIETCWSKYSLH